MMLLSYSLMSFLILLSQSKHHIYEITIPLPQSFLLLFLSQLPFLSSTVMRASPLLPFSFLIYFLSKAPSLGNTVMEDAPLLPFPFPLSQSPSLGSTVMEDAPLLSFIPFLLSSLSNAFSGQQSHRRCSSFAVPLSYLFYLKNAFFSSIL